MNENEIIEKFKEGDESIFSVLLQKYQNRIYTLCRYMLENPQDAEDAAQDTFIKAFQGLNSFTPAASFYTWLNRIAVNTCLDHQRKSSLRSLFFPAVSSDASDAFPSPLPTPETALADRESLRALQAALKRISGNLRSAIVLKELDGLSYEEIAEVLDVSIGTVKSRISRARDELRKYSELFTEQK